MLSNLDWSWKNIWGSRDNVLPHFHAKLFDRKLKLNIRFIKNVRELTFLVLFKRFFKIFFISFKLWNRPNVRNTGLPDAKIPGCQNHGSMETIQKYAEMYQRNSNYAVIRNCCLSLIMAVLLEGITAQQYLERCL